MNRYAHVIACAAISIVLLGCASNRSTESGHLRNYNRLQVTQDQDVLLYVAPSFDAAALSEVVAEGSAFRGTNARLDALPEPSGTELLLHLDKALATAISKVGLDSMPNARRLRVNAVVTDVDVPSRVLNVLATAAVGPVSTGGATVELVALDAASGEEVIAMVCTKKANVMTFSGFLGAYSVLAHAKQAAGECVDAFFAVVQKR